MPLSAPMHRATLIPDNRALHVNQRQAVVFKGE
uniref:Uncharacterized protein n=1 Tax=Anguilla anguilla TaxID=7936 RepID=A0A0E9SNK9_ANGAN